MSQQVAKKGEQAISQPGSGQAVMESKEQSASASANVRNTMKDSDRCFRFQLDRLERCKLIERSS